MAWGCLHLLECCPVLDWADLDVRSAFGPKGGLKLDLENVDTEIDNMMLLPHDMEKLIDLAAPCQPDYSCVDLVQARGFKAAQESVGSDKGNMPCCCDESAALAPDHDCREPGVALRTGRDVMSLLVCEGLRIAKEGSDKVCDCAGPDPIGGSDGGARECGLRHGQDDPAAGRDGEAEQQGCGPGHVTAGLAGGQNDARAGVHSRGQ